MWLWHIPALYDAALDTTAVHTLEHLSFAAAGLLYWWHLLSPIRSRLRLGGMGPIAYMGSTKILVGFLGIVLAFAPELIYDAYDHPGKTLGHDRARRPARRRPDHGARAVDRHGHRARVAVRAHAERVRGGGAARGALLTTP